VGLDGLKKQKIGEQPQTWRRSSTIYRQQNGSNRPHPILPRPKLAARSPRKPAPMKTLLLALAACAALYAPAAYAAPIGIVCQETYDAPGLPLNNQRSSTTYKLDPDNKTASYVIGVSHFDDPLKVTDMQYVIGRKFETWPDKNGIINEFGETVIDRIAQTSVRMDYIYNAKHELLFYISIKGVCQSVSVTPAL
jgi:hypothetical protein